MELLTLVEIVSASAGIALSILLCVFPRFGTASWVVAFTVLLGCVSSAILGFAPRLAMLSNDVILLAFSSLLLFGTSNWLATYAIERADYQRQLRNNRWFFSVIALGAPLLIAGLYFSRPPIDLASDRVGLLPLGPVGYGAAAYLLVLSVIGLANIEQTLRHAEEHVRWEIKFLLLGTASTFGALIYVASQVLLYAPEFSYLPSQTLSVFPLIFLCSCLLIFHSWRRSTGRGRVVVSQGIVYSTITLFSVGLYLVGSSLLARWVTEQLHPSVPAEPIIFLISAVLLAAVLLGTSFRHRVRRWIRRNLFAGNYDYRQLWMDATEKVRSIDPPAVTAAAIAQIIHDALGSLDISVWLRSADTMHLIGARGTISGVLPQDLPLLMDALADIIEPVEVADFAADRLSKWPPDFLSRAKASLIVPLISAQRLVGMITVGPDRSGRSFDREGREFLRVLAVHASSELHKSELLESLVQTKEAQAFQTFSTFLLHDLKNFASTLSLIAKNAARHHGNPDFQLDAFRSVFDTAEKMKRLCNGLRTFSSTLAANKKFDDLNQVIREVVEDFDSGLAKRLRLDLNKTPLVEIDRQEFARVLQNLILNAHEASPDGSIELTTRAQADKIVICVTDHGKGIPREFLEKELFQPFHTTKGDGLGIGLFQSKKIVESHHGVIEVDSEEGRGTIVRVILPAPAEVEVPPAAGPDLREAASPMPAVNRSASVHFG